MRLNDRAEVILGSKQRYTHLVFAAHQDDVEIMCGDGIVRCYDSDENGLVAVIVTNGAGSPRNGRFAGFSDEQMIAERRKEQIKAAKIGRYAALILLNYPSSEAHEGNASFLSDIKEIVAEYSPDTVYTHNPADKHRTHVNVVKAVVTALKQLGGAQKPKNFYGCEAWRDLDWLSDEDKVVFDLSGYKKLLFRLIAVHKSQIKGGKRYDSAIQGRRLANATFHRSHFTDSAELVSFGIDLSPLLAEGADIKEFTTEKIERFKRELLL